MKIHLMFKCQFSYKMYVTQNILLSVTNDAVADVLAWQKQIFILQYITFHMFKCKDSIEVQPNLDLNVTC